jgi:PAS domain S-box-containing protein
MRNLQIALGTGQSIAEEISLPTVSGVRHYEYILSPIHSTDGGVEAVVYTARDITERKQAEEAAAGIGKKLPQLV